jgi:hypothetical protein
LDLLSSHKSLTIMCWLIHSPHFSLQHLLSLLSLFSPAIASYGSQQCGFLSFHVRRLQSLLAGNSLTTNQFTAQLSNLNQLMASQAITDYSLVVNHYPLPLGQSGKVLLAFTSTVIPGFSLLEIHDQYFYSLLDVYMFRNGAFSSTIGG